MAVLKPVTRLITVESLYTAIKDTKPSTFVFAGEQHDFWEAVLVCSGEAVATGDERVYNLKEGDILFHKPMEYHRIAASGGVPLQIKNISFTAKGEGMKLFENRMFSLNYSFLEKFEDVFDKFQKALKLYNQNDEDYYYHANTVATALEGFLLRLSSKHPTDMSETSKEASLYKKIVLTMNENCEKALSLDDLSLLCNMSVSNIKRIFALFSDIPPAKYFLNLRIRKAATLLEKGMSSSLVARTLDFSSAAYFCTCFIRELGLSPSQYKKQKMQGSVY